MYQRQVLGLPIHLGENYQAWLLERHRQGQGSLVVTLNAEMVMQADRQPSLRQVIHSADLVIPDGAGVVWYLRCQGERVRRQPGIELAEALMVNLARTEKVFFYGAQPGVAAQAARGWEQRLPDLALAGAAHGYLTPPEREQLTQVLRDQQPSLVLVGLGVPRQELWIAQHRALCPGAIWIGVGGSLDIWAGTKRRAPSWLRDHSLEWAYRLYQEPWRWRRMLVLPRFAWRALVDTRGLRKRQGTFLCK